MSKVFFSTLNFLITSNFKDFCIKFAISFMNLLGIQSIYILLRILMAEKFESTL